MRINKNFHWIALFELPAIVMENGNNVLLGAVNKYLLMVLLLFEILNETNKEQTATVQIAKLIGDLYVTD